MDKTYKYKDNEYKNPFKVLEDTSLLDDKCEFNKDIKVVVSPDKVKDLTLEDFVNDGVDFLVKETENKNDNISSGDSAQIGSSGDSAQIGSSGDYAKIGSSGDSAQIGSSGDYAQIGSSGYYAQIGSSGYYAKIGSSGYYAKIGSSGYSAKIGSSGDSAQIGSSGDSAQIEITGNNSIGFACGNNCCIKAKKGTWISLAEYSKDKEGRYIPIFAKSAQIDNADYLDYKGKKLSEKYYYQLVNKEFVPLIIADGSKMLVLSEKKRDSLIIYKTQYLPDYVKNNGEKQFVVSNGKLFAHGDTLEKAISDLQFKILSSQDVQEHIKRVCEQGYMMATDYRLITGACQYGTNKWLEENGFTWEDKKTIEEVLELTKGSYGHERLKEAFEKYKNK